VRERLQFVRRSADWLFERAAASLGERATVDHSSGHTDSSVRPLAGRIRVLLADDHCAVREGLRLTLERQRDMEVIAEADDGRSAVARALELKPDVVLMDLSMPGLNGLLATRAILEAAPSVRICVLTRHSDEAHLFELLRAGVLGYVLKQSPAATFVTAIRYVSAGREYVDDALMSGMTRTYRTTGSGQPSTLRALSQREEDVIRRTAWGHSNKEIALALGLSVKTVEAHKSNAMRKLHFTSRLDIVRYAVLKGWLNDPGS
jgi:two-component system, NarL family, response regulator NreC